MNATDLIQSFFDPGAVARLATAAGLEPSEAGRVLEAGLPTQLQALADAASTTDGEVMIAEATGSLPVFGSVEAALDEAGGASNLQQAGELLAPVLLGDVADTLPAQVARQAAADPARVQSLLQMTLPLLLSRLGQAGLRPGNVAPVFAGLDLDNLRLGGLNVDGLGLGGVMAAAGLTGMGKGMQEALTGAPTPEALTADPHLSPAVPLSADVSVYSAVPVVSEVNVSDQPGLDAVTPEQALPGQPFLDPPMGTQAPEFPEPRLAGADSAEPDPAPALPDVPDVDVAAPERPPEIHSPAIPTPAVLPVPAVMAPDEPEEAAPSPAPAADPNTPEGLLDYLKARLGGSVGHQIGAVAGFGGGARRQAAVAALPVVLAALVGQAQAGGGAVEVGKLRNMARPFEALTDAEGRVPAGLLDSPVEVARIEGQGRGLLGSLFGDLNGVTGRLGSALGGSGDSSRRLLAVMTPLVLSALTRAHPEGSGVLGGLLGNLGGLLPALLPAGLSSLGVVVRNLASGTPLPGAVSGGPAVSTVKAATVRASPSAPVASPLKPPRPVAASPTPPPAPPVQRRNPLWWWLLPLLLLLLLGGCWLLQNRPATPATPGTATTATDEATGAAAFAITEPQGGAAVSGAGFTMRGTGPAGGALEIFRGDASVGNVTVGGDGTWSADVVDAAAPAGPQTYAVRNAAGAELGSVNLEVGAADTGSADTSSTDTSSTDANSTDSTATGDPSTGDTSAGAAAITEPQGGAAVAATGFTLRGTGPAGATLTLLRDGTEIGPVTVGEDGTWTQEVTGDAASGEQTYALNDAAGQEVASVKVQAGADASAADTSAADATAPAAGDVAAPGGAAGLSIGSPASGAEVSDAGFALSGTGTAGRTFEVLEDGVSIGSFTVGQGGTWTRQVPGPSAGAKTYSVRSADGQEVASLPVTVAASAAGTQTACTQALSVSLNDGDTVTAPYRFGGVGDASAYTVTVKRGERVIGTKTVPVGAGCNWSFTSNPGGGAASQVTYEVRPANASASAAAASLTLNVR